MSTVRTSCSEQCLQGRFAFGITSKRDKPASLTIKHEIHTAHVAGRWRRKEALRRERELSRAVEEMRPRQRKAPERQRRFVFKTPAVSSRPMRSGFEGSLLAWFLKFMAG